MGIWENLFDKAKGFFAAGEEGGRSGAPPKKRCYYDLLELEKDASEDDIKKAYKKLALKWHPDKASPERREECTAYFVLLQQAYEVLNNPQERAFYDRHRENILRCGSAEEKVDTGMQLGAYFQRSCFKGFGDEDQQDFYVVYRDVFQRLAAEDYPYIDDLDERNYPVFGNSTSDYDSIVNIFYGFWMDFSTKRSFAWLDKWNLQEATSRTEARPMERENKQLRDMGRRVRNEEIQKLAAHVRRLDPRVKEQRERLEFKRQQQMKKAQEEKLSAIRRNLERIQLEDYAVDEEEHRAHIENLREIEEQLDLEFGTVGGNNHDDDDGNNSTASDGEGGGRGGWSCLVCEKSFKTDRAYHNHQRSKKHKQNVELVRKHMREEDKELFSKEHGLHSDEDGGGDEDGAYSQPPQQQQLTKRAKKKAKKMAAEAEAAAATAAAANGNGAAEEGGEGGEMSEIEEREAGGRTTEGMSRNQNNSREGTKKASAKSSKQKNQRATAAAASKPLPSHESSKEPSTTQQPAQPVPSRCETCDECFDSRTKLFQHLRESGHASLKAESTAKGKEKKSSGVKGGGRRK